MLSICLASLGWGTWWVAAFLSRFAPDLAPGFALTSWIAGVFASLGLLVALFTIRARRIWLLFTLVLLLANASLLLVPLVARSLGRGGG